MFCATVVPPCATVATGFSRSQPASDAASMRLRKPL